MKTILLVALMLTLVGMATYLFETNKPQSDIEDLQVWAPSNDSCGGNCPSGSCPSCVCGSSKNMVNIASECAKGSWNQSCCQCIAKNESGGNANAMNYNTNGSYDVGLWQVNDFNWGQCNSGKAPCSPSANLACAKKIYGWGGNTWKNWATCSKCGCCNSN